MKNYNFKIKVENPENAKLIKIKNFSLELADDIDLYDMFEEAIIYLNNEAHFYFKSYTEDYFEFKLFRGKRSASCWAESYDCPCCGGTIDIGGEYDPEDE